VAVGDGVAESNDGGCGGRGLHIDFGELIPMIDVFGISERGSADEVAVDVVGSGARAGVSGLAGRRRLEIERDGEIGKRKDGIVDGIGDEFCAGRNVGFRLASKSERAIAGGIDCWRRC